MPVYQFEGRGESGFGVSGILEAKDETEAHVKAGRFCDTVTLVRIMETGPGQSATDAGKTGAVSRTSTFRAAGRGRDAVLFVAIRAAVRRFLHLERDV